MTTNLEMVVTVADALQNLRDEVVLLGGAVTQFLITDKAAPPVRPTDDVDVIVQLATPVEYAALSTRLRDLGFKNDTSDGAPVCRWIVKSIKVDVMPTDVAAIGFANRWYSLAFATAQIVELDRRLKVRVISAPCFIATKLEAFNDENRSGGGDFQASHDLEDIVAVIDGRAEIVNDVMRAPPDLRDYLAAALRDMLTNSAFLDALPGHLPPDDAGQARVGLVRSRLDQIAAAGATVTRDSPN